MEYTLSVYSNLGKDGSAGRMFCSNMKNLMKIKIKENADRKQVTLGQ